MTSKILYKSNLRTEAKHLKSGNTIITDAPIDNHGKGEAFSPTDLLATSLAQCVLTIMGIKAADMQLSIDDSTAEVTKFMGSNPRRVSEILIDFYIKGDFSEKERKILEAAGRACPVSKSLHIEVKQNLTFHWEQK
ncbi:MAG: OsmC family protein [Flavobacteriales bacterium]|jgi:uncharacterized OsmC-like protein|nr:OsmC family protein [Flavobacteriales bacterium]